jgi:hypothetical protein
MPGKLQQIAWEISSALANPGGDAQFDRPSDELYHRSFHGTQIEKSTGRSLFRLPVQKY